MSGGNPSTRNKSGLSDELVDFLQSRGEGKSYLGEASSKPNVSREQQIHLGSHEKQLVRILSSYDPGVLLDGPGFSTDRTSLQGVFFRANMSEKSIHRTRDVHLSHVRCARKEEIFFC